MMVGRHGPQKTRLRWANSHLSPVRPAPNECFAVGDWSNSQPDSIMTSDGGRSWSAFDVIATDGASAVSCSDDLHCVVLGPYAQYANFTADGGKTWSSSRLPSFPGSVGTGQTSYYSVSCPSTSYCVAAGETGSLESAIAFTTDGGKSWSPSPGSTYFRSVVYVTCPSLERCYGVAVGEPFVQGTLITATGPSGAWHEEKGTPLIPGDTPMLSCPTVEDCVSFEEDAFGDAYASLVTSDGWRSVKSSPLAPTISSLPAVICPTRLWCAALGFAGNHGVLEETADGGTKWTTTVLPAGSGYWGNGDGEISCPVAGDCLLVSRSYYGTTSAWTKSANGRWIGVPVGDSSFTASAAECPTELTCLIVGSEAPNPIRESNSPEMAEPNPSYAIFRSDDAGRSWDRVVLPAALSTGLGGLASISCGSPVTCTASGGDGSMFTVDGGETWSGIDLPYETDPIALSCPSRARLYRSRTGDCSKWWSSRHYSPHCVPLLNTGGVLRQSCRPRIGGRIW